MMFLAIAGEARSEAFNGVVMLSSFELKLGELFAMADMRLSTRYTH